MKSQLFAPVFATVLALASTVGFSTTTLARPQVGGGGSSNPAVGPSSGSQPPSTGGTTFSCLPQGGNYATVGQRGGGQGIPLIVWTAQGSNYFGGSYTPQNRCNMVSQRLNTAVSANGGRLQNLLLTHGIVNRETVICAIGTTGANSCNANNMLFTLKPENANRAGQILGQLLQISRVGASAGVIYETGLNQTYVDLGEWEKNAMGSTQDNTHDHHQQQWHNPTNQDDPGL